MDFDNQSQFVDAVINRRFDEDDEQHRVTSPIDFNHKNVKFPLLVSNTIFESSFDATGMRCRNSVRFHNCVFLQNVILKNSRIDGGVTFSDCRFHDGEMENHDFSHMHVTGSVFFDNLRYNLPISFRSCHIGNNFDFQCDDTAANILSDGDCESRRKPLDLNGSTIGGSVYVSGSQRRLLNFLGGLDLKCHIRGQLQICNAIIEAHAGEYSLDLGSASIQGLVDLERTRFIGALNCRGDFGHQVSFTRCEIIKSKVIAIDLIGTTIKRELVISECRIEGDLALHHATLGSGMILKGIDAQGVTISKHVAAVRNEIANGLVPVNVKMDSDNVSLPARIVGDIDLRFAKVKGRLSIKRCLVTGIILARQAHIHGDFELVDTLVGAEMKSTTLDLELLTVAGNFIIKDTIVYGRCHLEDSRISGEADFWDAIIAGHLDMRSTSITGRIFADEIAEMEKQQGGLAIASPPLPNTSSATPHGVSHVKGHPKIASDRQYPIVFGNIDLSFSKLSQVYIKISNGKLHPELLGVAGKVEKHLKLDGANIGTLDITSNSLKNFPMITTNELCFEALPFSPIDKNNVFYDRSSSWRYEQPSLRDVARSLIWLIMAVSCCLLFYQHKTYICICPVVFFILLGCFLIYKSMYPPDRRFVCLDFFESTIFNSGTYLKLELWLRSRGQDAEADEVFLSRKRHETEQRLRINDLQSAKANRFSSQYLWCWFIDFISGYGVRPRRIVHFYFLLWAINLGVMLNPLAVERPTVFVQEAARDDQSTALVDEHYKKRTYNPWDSNGGYPDRIDAKSRNWTFWNAFFMSWRIQVPVVSVFAESDWTFATRKMETSFLNLITFNDYAVFMMTLNLILLPLLIAAATGHLKKNSV